MRVGLGFDVHPFAEGRDLVLGGIAIEHPRGLAGHSDGDALLHSVADALLGALALGDLGQHFSDQDEEWRGAASREILSRVVAMLAERDAEVINVDATVLADEPKITPHRDRMRASVAEILGVGVDRVSIKATRSEGVSGVPGSDGIAVHTVALVQLAKESTS